MRKEPTSVFTIVYIGRGLALIAAVGFGLRGVDVPEGLAGDPDNGAAWHVLVWMCFASLSLGLFCVLGVLARLAEGMNLN